MNLSNPISDVIPSGHGHVLAVLARTTTGLSGRRIAELMDGALSHVQVSSILQKLASAGIVLVEHQPPAYIYSFNHDHVAADAIVELASLRQRLIEWMKVSAKAITPPALGVCLFESMARGEGVVGSDIDVLVVRPDSLPGDDATWTELLHSLASDVERWSGNPCSVIDYSESEFADMIERQERLVRDIADHGIRLAGSDIRRFVSSHVRKRLDDSTTRRTR